MALDLNPIASKYRIKAREAMRNARAGTVKTVDTNNLPAKSFAEDFVMTPATDNQVNLFTPVESVAPPAPQENPRQDVRERLEQLRKLFTEEDMNE